MNDSLRKETVFTIRKDGSAWCAVDQDFVNLQESEAGFGDSPVSAISNLLASNRQPQEVFVVYTNTDLTEGRGHQYPIAVCKVNATALRMAEKAYVMGSDAPVEKVELLRVGGQLYGPVRVIEPTQEDVSQQAKADAMNAAIKKAIDAGVSKEEILAITDGAIARVISRVRK